jgi:DNA invertase Pin-like site-specific DNA recombinase
MKMSHATNKLNDRQVSEIRKLRRKFVDLDTIAGAYKVSRNTVVRAVKGEGSYSYFTESLSKRGKKPVATEDQIQKIKTLRGSGKSYWAISLETNLSASTVRRILCGEGAYA